MSWAVPTLALTNAFIPMKSGDAEIFYNPLYDNGEKVRSENIASLGYRFTARFISIGDKYKLFELLPLRSDRPAEVCFLTLNSIKQRGVIIHDPFHEHRSMLMSMNLLKEKNLNPHTIQKQQIKPEGDQDRGKETGGTLAEEEGKTAALYRRTAE